MPSGPGNAAMTGVGRWVLMLSILIGLVLAPRAEAQSATVRAELSASSISIDESVTLTVLANGVDGELDTSTLERDFEVVGRSSSRQIENMNGRITNTRNWVLELMPRQIGIFTVPPVSVKGVKSQLLSLTVSDAPSGADRQLFVEAAVDQSEPWVQSQVILTLRVFQAVSILDGSLGEPEAAELIVRPLGEDRRFNAERDGRAYDVLERRFALFPQASGRLEISPITLIASVPNSPTRAQGFFPDTRRLTRRTRPITLEVQARPSGGNGWWLPAQDVTIDSRWAEDVQEARVDQPLTREVRLRAAGVSDAQLPTIQTPIIDGAGIYADDPVRATQAGADGLAATQKVTWAVIPQKVGLLKLPEIQIDWFDTATGQVRTAFLPEEIITVKPAIDAGSTQAPTDTAIDSSAVALTENREGEDDAISSNRETSVMPGMDAAHSETSWFWRMLATAALLGWGVTGVLLYRARHRSTSRTRIISDSAPVKPSLANASLEEVRRASASGSTTELAAAVLDWAKRQWTVNPPLSLTEISRRLDSREATDALRGLDAALYRPVQNEAIKNDEKSSDGSELPRQFADVLAAAVSMLEPERASSDRRQHLPDL